MCGEHKISNSLINNSQGSSPRVRGTHNNRSGTPDREGIIPACAGNTSLCRASIHFTSGSSPRVRGTLQIKQRYSVLRGIIPACAGNTSITMLTCEPVWDHPRVCGEHPSLRPYFASFAGSSPRVRGTHPARHHRPARTGIIPACAGNTWTTRPCTPASRDHPRVCGEHMPPAIMSPDCMGSSPRVRGTHHTTSSRCTT